jgi:phage gpG-like protein
MKASFTGDIAKLDKWAKRLREVPKVMDGLSEQLAEETIDLIKDGFEKSRDPYGKKWAPLKLRDGRPLEDNGGLKGSWFKKYARRDGFKVANGKSYAIIQHAGSGIYGPKKEPIVPKKAKALRLGKYGFAKSVKGTVARPMVPYKKRLPKKWLQAYQEVAEDFLTEHFR